MEINGMSGSKTMSLTVIILTHTEELHIARCIQSLQPLAARVVVVDSGSKDRTVEIAQSLGAEVFFHPWKNYAEQFQWGLDNHTTGAEWVMRMDADEYLEHDLQAELPGLIRNAPQNVQGIYLKRKVFFYGKWIRHGGFYPHTLLRLWRAGQGRIEQRWMDEHIILPPGARTITAQGHLVDDNHKGITFWIQKHNQYASREAVDMLNIKYPLLPRDASLVEFDDPQAKRKRLLKEKLYARLPAGLRALLYFLYRYILRLGFLDGSLGFVWHFMQGFWYRLLVDVKVKEIEDRSGGDVEKMKQILLQDHGINLF